MKAKAVQERKAIREKVGNVSIPIYETRSKGYSGFTVAWYENGKRCRKFFAELKDARLHAQTVAVKIENQEREVLRLTPEDSRMFASCTQKLRPLGVTLEAAVREYVEARKIIGNHPLSDALRFWHTHHGDSLPKKSFQEVVGEFVAAQGRDGVSPEYLAELKRFLLLAAEQFQMNIMEISASMLDDYLRSMDCSPRLQKYISTEVGRPL